MSLGWFLNLADAEAYFTDERLVTTSWDALADDPTKTKAVKNAYNRIYHSPRYDVPTYAGATPAQLIVLKIINGEMAYYLAQHMEDEDRRMGLEAQHVIAAGIVKEQYDREKLGELPVPAIVDDLLDDAGFVVDKAFGIVDIDRDENESVKTKVDEF